MAQLITPNMYDLEGGGITVNYSTSSISGKPQLSYKKGRTMLNFSGDEIGSTDTTIGTLITVAIARTVDRSFTSFSFLVPKIGLSAATSTQSVRTIGVTTVEKTSIGGPLKGQLQTYKTVELAGTARHVDF